MKRKVLLAGVVLGSILLVAVGYMWGYDIWRHGSLKSDFSSVSNAMQSGGGENFVDESGCIFYPEKLEVVGKGRKICNLMTSVSYAVSNEEDADELNQDVYGHLLDNGFVEQRYRPVTALDPSEDSSTGASVVRHGKTDAECGLNYRYTRGTSSEDEIAFTLFCDDTSWFARNFQKNNSIFSYW